MRPRPGCSGAEPTPSQAFDDRHLDYDIAEALADLPPEYRAAVVLCDIEGLTYEEIADALGVKLGTVRSRIHRGRAQLRAALEHRRPGRGVGVDERRGRCAAGSLLGEGLQRQPSDVLACQARRGKAGGPVSHLGRWLSALVDGELDGTNATGCSTTSPDASRAGRKPTRCARSSGG